MEVHAAGRLVVVLVDENPLSRAGVQLAEVPFVMDEATGPHSPQKGQVGVFTEHPVVRRTTADDLVWQVAE